MPIKVLEPKVVAKIAAGEVVERPAFGRPKVVHISRERLQKEFGRT